MLHKKKETIYTFSLLYSPSGQQQSNQHQGFPNVQSFVQELMLGAAIYCSAELFLSPGVILSPGTVAMEMCHILDGHVQVAVWNSIVVWSALTMMIAQSGLKAQDRLLLFALLADLQGF